jgi:hypothetical protein
MMGTANSGAATGRTRPFEVGDGRARPAGLSAEMLGGEIEMVAARIVEVDGLLDQAQTKNACVEVYRSLGIVADKGDVMKTLNAHKLLLKEKNDSVLKLLTRPD